MSPRRNSASPSIETFWPVRVDAAAGADVEATWAEAGEATLRDVVEGTNRGASSLRSDPERGWGVRKAVEVVVEKFVFLP